MKKYIFTIALYCFAAAAYTQSNIPSNASLVIKYYGAHLSNSMPIKKIDSYNFIKNNLFKELKIDSVHSLENTGIDFEKDVSQYMVMEDSSMSFVTLFSIRNTSQFLQLVKHSFDTEIITEKKNGLELLTIANDKYLGWNDKQAVLVYTRYTKPNNYYYSGPVADTTTTVMVDSAQSIPPPPVIEEVPAEEPVIEKPKTIKKGKAKINSKNKSKSKKKATKKAAPKEIEEEQAPEATDDMAQYDTTIVAPPAVDYVDTIENAKRENWYKEQEEYIKGKQKFIADSIIQTAFTVNVSPIENDISYKKVIDPSSHISIWLNYDNFIGKMGSYFWGGYGYNSYNALAGVGNATDNSNFKTGINLYFDKDKMRLEQKSYSPDAGVANLGKEIYHSKQQKSLAGYINPDHIAYLSASINTEALANYYYRVIRQYLNNMPYTRNYADMIDVYIDFLEIMIDEKALSELAPGNMVFVLHDMKTKTVTYKDYTYDDNFKQTEVEKTKQELSPNFTFAMETKKPGFMEKLAKLPLKYAEKEKFNYKDRGGYYEFVFDEGKYPLSSLYFMVKDNKLIITTSKETIDLTIKNGSYSINGDLKKSIFKNNYSARIDTKRLLQQIGPELSTEVNRQIRKYLEDNLGDVKMESRLKDEMIQTTATMNITGEHSNSFEFIFNMLDSINKIMENNKKEKEEKVY
ncbi:MAG: hypothetical protein QM802_06350 [Agriterribacter sp.]